MDRPADAPPLTHSHMVWAYVELAVSLVLGNTGAAISGPPWSAIIADTIPLKQRGLCVMIQSWVNTFIGIFSGGIGFMVGESWSCFGRKPCITAEQIWCTQQR